MTSATEVDTSTTGILWWITRVVAWATILGVVGICLFAEMSGRVAAVTSRGTFDLIRERLGPRVGLLNLIASMLVTLLTLTAEIGGVALAIELGTDADVREWLMAMTLVARAIERIGDNAVDIGEQTAFIVTGLFREFSDSSHPAQQR